MNERGNHIRLIGRNMGRREAVLMIVTAKRGAELCADCLGTGEQNEAVRTTGMFLECPACQGTGEVLQEIP